MKLLTWLGGLVFLTQWVIFFLIVSDDPFFGDSISTVSRAALRIYDSDLQSISYPPGYDPGHPLLIPLLYAIVWKVFGLNLAISHAINFIFALGILALVFNWVQRESGPVEAFVVTVVLSVIPLFLAQSAMMNTHLPLTFFLLLAVRSLLRSNYVWAGIWMGVMMLIHLQAVFYWGGILFWSLVFGGSDRRAIKPWALMTLIPVLAFSAWVLYHYRITGWAVSSPDYAAHRGMPGIRGVIKNLILADWRISDYGQIALILPLIVYVVRNFRGKTVPVSLTMFFVLFFVNAFAIAFTTQTGPAHRYFLPCIPLLAIASNEVLRGMRTIWSVLVLVVVISGHWWFYPGKTLGDATLQYRQTFDLMASVCLETSGNPIYTFAPLGNPSRAMFLEDGRSCFTSLYGVDMDTVRFIVQGNVIGDLSDSLRDKLETEWHGCSFEREHVYLNLFANPKYLPNKPDTWQLRERSDAEKRIEDLKQRFRSAE
ncbi:MAG: glycosyltransferase family 39 protein [Flavobacteriales bacterium]|nr:glycosyltransferase family 39 protein [Flavobacteriales bacterium]